ncbi:hypothetical protein LINPERHAP2_LOCUS7349 [Linum perenne]
MVVNRWSFLVGRSNLLLWQGFQWIQVYGISVHLRSKGVFKSLGDAAGDFLDCQEIGFSAVSIKVKKMEERPKSPSLSYKGNMFEVRILEEPFDFSAEDGRFMTTSSLTVVMHAQLPTTTDASPEGVMCFAEEKGTRKRKVGMLKGDGSGHLSPSEGNGFQDDSFLNEGEFKEDGPDYSSPLEINECLEGFLINKKKEVEMFDLVVEASSLTELIGEATLDNNFSPQVQQLLLPLEEEIHIPETTSHKREEEQISLTEASFEQHCDLVTTNGRKLAHIMDLRLNGSQEEALERISEVAKEVVWRRPETVPKSKKDLELKRIKWNLVSQSLESSQCVRYVNPKLVPHES